MSESDRQPRSSAAWPWAVVVILLIGLIAWLLTNQATPQDADVDVDIEVPAAPGTGTTGSSP